MCVGTVHTPILIKEAMKKPEAAAAFDNKARQNNVAVHSASLMDLCHHKHSELAQALRGDKVEDMDGDADKCVKRRCVSANKWRR